MKRSRSHSTPSWNWTNHPWLPRGFVVGRSVPQHIPIMAYFGSGCINEPLRIG
jgi:hypothetical protein